ncbi:MAG: aminotransferase class V-fold PLP-dependent enzyme [Egibacteraceae bacterium]
MSVPPRVYLDHASAMPAHPAALAAADHVARAFPGDPARQHAEGHAARDVLESARAAVGRTVGVAAERLLFTAGGTESVHLAVRGAAAANRTRPSRIVSSAVEHSAVLAAADATDHEHVRVGVDALGRLDLDALAEALRPGAALVSLQHANHETGTLQPLAAAAALCREADALLHVDACQTVGRLPVDAEALGADFLSLSAAKFGGGRGVGALGWSARARFRAQLTGDEREGRRRAGLEHLPGIAAMAETLLHLRPDDPAGPAAAEAARCDRLRRRLREQLRALDDVEVHGPDDGSLPHIVAISALYVDGQALVGELDRAGFAVHSGSSCASTSGQPSHVLVAMGALTHGHVRASLGPQVDSDAADAFAVALGRAVTGLRARVGR